MLIKNFTKDVSFDCEIADNFWKQAKGLSFSKPHNILFKFNPARRWEFWMFGMHFDIWMAFLDDKGKVFELVRAGKLTFNPKTWKIYKPSKPCKYVLETFDKLVEIGDVLQL